MYKAPAELILAGRGLLVAVVMVGVTQPVVLLSQDT